MRFDDVTEDDIDTLVEALEEWEHKGASGELVGDMFGAMFIDKATPEAKAKYEAERAESRRKRERETAVRKERSVILRAKLLSIRNDRRMGTLQASVSTF